MPRTPIFDPSVDDRAVSEAVRRLERAARTRQPCEPVRDLIGSDDIGRAYRVQQQLASRRLAAGAVLVGHKIGLTSAVVQRQLGVDTPDFGLLFADMDVSGLPVVPSGRLVQPKVEAEIAFVLAADLDLELADVRQVRGAVAYAVPALEIVDSRIEGWDITIADTVADNASSGLFVLGERQLSLAEFEPRDEVMELYLDDRLVGEGTGEACLGDPLNALLWLARTSRDLGRPLRAGQIVLSGALGAMVPVRPGSSVRARFRALGTVTADFSAADFSAADFSAAGRPTADFSTDEGR